MSIVLSDLPWARSTSENTRIIVLLLAATNRQASAGVYDQAPLSKPPPKPLAWIEVGKQLEQI